jgi:hypothetical protein
MRFWPLIFVLVCFLLCSSLALAQARALVMTAGPTVRLANASGERVVLGSVSLGRQRSFTTFNIQAAGSITPDPEMNGAAFQLQFLICDQPDCQGEIRRDARILPEANAASQARVLATKSFGLSTHNIQPVDLTGYRSKTPSGVLYLAVVLKSLRTPGNMAFTAKLNLLRVDVMP